MRVRASAIVTLVMGGTLATGCGSTGGASSGEFVTSTPYFTTGEVSEMPEDFGGRWCGTWSGAIAQQFVLNIVHNPDGGPDSYYHQYSWRGASFGQSSGTTSRRPALAHNNTFTISETVPSSGRRITMTFTRDDSQGVLRGRFVSESRSGGQRNGPYSATVRPCGSAIPISTTDTS